MVYDQVESLAGSYVPPNWEARDGTTYHHQTYVDFLSLAQDAGLVGGRRNPDVTPGIESDVLERDSDFSIPILPPSGGRPTIPTDGSSIEIRLPADPLDSHRHIVTTEGDNEKVLERIRERIGQE